MTASGLVSVVIASNRPAPYLTEAVRSLREQTVPVHEILLVDDGSPPPGLESRARELGIDYVRQQSAGVSVARNRGAVRASGEWIAFLDDDDFWFPTRVEEQLRALTGAPGAIACYSDFVLADEAGATLSEVNATDASREELIRRGNGVPAIGSLLLHRETYLALGGMDPGLRRAEDLDLILRLLQAGEFVKAEGPLFGYRQHQGQTTRDGRDSLGSYAFVVRRLIARAERTGDGAHAELLREHLRRTLPAIADFGAAEFLSRVRHGRLPAAMGELRWSISMAGRAFVPAIGRALRRRAGGARR